MATPARSQNSKKSLPVWLKERKWLTLVGLSVLLVTTFYGYYSVWGALFVFWGGSSAVSGQAFLLEPIAKHENPVLFWAIVIMWIGFGFLYILADLYPQYWSQY